MSRSPRQRIETEAGTEVQCTQCKEFWPEDAEFYHMYSTRGAHSWCKACYAANPKIRQKTVRANAAQKVKRQAAQRGASANPYPAGYMQQRGAA